ncbi:MAG: UDP-N-acetyl-D-glucosamine dehydrogenase [Deltaproteobacteria bacterium GWC2_65_14]|nr:MAG: UDP-N-acetyl-D-glucosamine dehydrogenase [Deltaproteobacteria bacterium GWC2_65_14]
MGSPDDLLSRIRRKEFTAAVVGLGYVGLPLAVEFAEAGIPVIGIDSDGAKIRAIRAGKSYIGDVSSESLRAVVEAGRLRATSDYSALAEADTVNICVPTPLRKTKDPDLSYVVSAAEQVAKYLHPGMLVVLESTTYPGTTDELLVPLFEEKGFKAGRDIFLAFSPERVDPGNPIYTTKNIPKVVGGATPRCTKVAVALYQGVLERVHPVSTATVAEMVKLLENTFRAVNIGLVNEIALMCDRMGIDVWEVIDAAKSKPFGFMPFYPGPGIGGHCIPLDPFYLSWKAKQYGFESRFIELAGVINGQMPHYVVGKVVDALNRFKKSVNGAKILVLGVAYKKDISDVRESPALDILQLLGQKEAKLSYCDPHVPLLDEHGIRMNAEKFSASTLRKADCVVVVTDHSAFDYRMVARESKVVVDARNALKGKNGSKIIKL